MLNCVIFIVFVMIIDMKADKKSGKWKGSLEFLEYKKAGQYGTPELH